MRVADLEKALDLYRREKVWYRRITRLDSQPIQMLKRFYKKHRTAQRNEPLSKNDIFELCRIYLDAYTKPRTASHHAMHELRQALSLTLGARKLYAMLVLYEMYQMYRAQHGQKPYDIEAFFEKFYQLPSDQLSWHNVRGFKVNLDDLKTNQALNDQNIDTLFRVYFKHPHPMTEYETVKMLKQDLRCLIPYFRALPQMKQQLNESPERSRALARAVTHLMTLREMRLLKPDYEAFVYRNIQSGQNIAQSMVTLAGNELLDSEYLKYIELAPDCANNVVLLLKHLKQSDLLNDQAIKKGITSLLYEKEAIASQGVEIKRSMLIKVIKQFRQDGLFDKTVYHHLVQLQPEAIKNVSSILLMLGQIQNQIKSKLLTSERIKITKFIMDEVICKRPQFINALQAVFSWLVRGLEMGHLYHAFLTSENIMLICKHVEQAQAVSWVLVELYGCQLLTPKNRQAFDRYAQYAHHIKDAVQVLNCLNQPKFFLILASLDSTPQRYFEGYTQKEQIEIIEWLNVDHPFAHLLLGLIYAGELWGPLWLKGELEEGHYEQCYERARDYLERVLQRAPEDSPWYQHAARTLYHLSLNQEGLEAAENRAHYLKLMSPQSAFAIPSIVQFSLFANTGKIKDNIQGAMLKNISDERKLFM